MEPSLWGTDVRSDQMVALEERMQNRTQTNLVTRSWGLVFTLTAAIATAACSGTSPDARTATSVRASSTTSAAVPKAQSSGCGELAPAGTTDGEVEQTISSGGMARTFRLALPANYDPDAAAPLVFNFHGYRGSAAAQSAYSGLSEVGRERGLIVVTPDGLGGTWQLPTREQGTVDVVFVKDLLAQIESAYCVDVNRVFATGYSRGAGMAADVGCGLPDTFGALALVAWEYRPAQCRPIPVTAFHGTTDPQVPYQPGDVATQGATGVTGIESPSSGTLGNMADWAELDGCRADPTVEKLDPDVEHRTYPGCVGDAQVELYTIVGGGHTWPGAEIKVPSFGETTDTIDATDLIVRFFLRHPRHPD